MLAGEAQTDKEKRAVAYLHVLGRDPDRDVAVFGYGVNPKIPFGLTDFPVVLRSPASPYTLSVIVHGVANERTVYATRATVLDSNVAWTRVATPADDIVNLDFKGSTSTRSRTRTRRHTSLSQRRSMRPTWRRHRSLSRPERSVLEDLGVAADGLYVRSRQGGFGKLTRVAFPADGTLGDVTNVALPFQGSIRAIATDPREPASSSA